MKDKTEVDFVESLLIEPKGIEIVITHKELNSKSNY